MNSPVVITGLGVVSPIGIGVDDLWQSLITGKSGVKVREDFADTRLPFRIAAPVTDFDGKKFVKPRKAIKIMCEPIQFGYVAAMMATEMAGIQPDELDPDRKGIVFGTETFVADPQEVATVFRKCIENQSYQHDLWGEYAMREIQPLWMLKYLPNMVASHISIGMDARGPSNSICQGEASGLLAFIEATNLILRGAADIVVVGATGSRMSLTSMFNRGKDLLSKNIDDPANASRPFDANRDGIVVGEGAAAMVVESLDHALARGATPIARIAGWNQSYCNLDDAKFSSAIENSLRGSLFMSGKQPADIGFVNAQGNSSIHDDACEAKAIQSVLADIPVSANKANFGSLGPGGSTVEIVSAICSMKNNVVPPNPNFKTPDENCPVNLSNDSVPMTTQSVAKISFSSTGQIASLILDREF